MSRPDLNLAAAEAGAITEPWSKEGGPGGAIVIFDADGPRREAAGGLAVPEHGVPFSADTPSRWASISKQFCAATALLAGLDLDRELGRFVRGLPDGIAAVPLGRALDMTGGIPDVMETLWLLGLPFTAGLREEELLDFVRRLPGVAGPAGREMTYSNTGWRLAGAAFAERGDEYGGALRQSLLLPLDLEGIHFPSDEGVLLPGLATPCWHDGTAWRRGRYGLHFSPSGGLAGSARDLARWGAALLAGRGAAQGLLAALSAPRAFADGTSSSYGLGLMRVALGDFALVGHGGSLPGIKTHLLMAPALGCGIALIANREDLDPLALAMRVMAAMTGRTLPKAASLPAGLYAEEAGEAWAEVEGTSLSFMNATEPLFEAADSVRTRPAYLEAALNQGGNGALEGRIGGVRRRLLPVPAGTPLEQGLVGSWREPVFGATLEVSAAGMARLPGSALHDTSPLRPLPGGRAIADRRHGPWRQRPMLMLEADGGLRLVTHRSRVLRFRRA